MIIGVLRGSPCFRPQVVVLFACYDVCPLQNPGACASDRDRDWNSSGGDFSCDCHSDASSFISPEKQMNQTQTPGPRNAAIVSATVSISSLPFVHSLSQLATGSNRHWLCGSRAHVMSLSSWQLSASLHQCRALRFWFSPYPRFVTTLMRVETETYGSPVFAMGDNPC